ncbi:acyl-CoA thioesterase [Alkaliphilus pronyensis]|uniref:acyl-CoA thioesterase n=1 Tax=Alkaliphilus pronyensis TaxID=1482732 RepID=UPI0018658522|nr:thioesterase family protein [Alkaliphilus pronyensis]
MTLSFKYKFKPRFSDIDRYGIAHHSKYFCWFEEARYYFLESILKIPQEELVQLYAPITSLKADYKKSIIFENSYVIVVSLSIDEFKSFVQFQYEIMDCNEETIYAKGLTEHVFTKSNGELLFEIPDFLYEKIKLIRK